MPNSELGVPNRVPVELSSESPVGSSGDTSQVLTSPPNTIGWIWMIDMLVVRFSRGSGYASSRGESSSGSLASQIPSPSSSFG